MENGTTASDSFNKNDKQLFFNQIRGAITEVNIADDWCSITLQVGHENPRLVNFSIKKAQFDALTHKCAVGDKVLIRFFLTSRHKHGRWHTTANILELIVA